MNIEITDSHCAEIFTILFQHMRLFTDQISIGFSTTGMYLQTMDSARVSIIEITLPNTWFQKYECSEDVVLGINATILFKILNAREKSQRINIVYESESTDALYLHFLSEDKTIFDKHFQCPLMDIESETMTIPPIEYAAEITIPSAVFSTLIQQLKTFGDSLDITCNETKIELAAKSPDSGTMAVEVNIDDLSSFAINEGEELRMSFSLNQLHHICMFNKLAKEMTIGLCDQYPMSVFYNITDDGAKLSAYLAPKIGGDD
jgi:proliferating cell nuclear antigen